jgi:hypothetical protein
VLQASDNARGVARPFGGAARDFASRNHLRIVQPRERFSGGC